MSAAADASAMTCPAGWARSDYVVTGVECVVPVWLRTAALAFMMLPNPVTAGSCLYYSFRMASKGESRRPAYRTHTKVFSAAGGLTIAPLLALLSDDIGNSVWWPVLLMAALARANRLVFGEISDLLGASISAAFAMQPATAGQYTWGVEIFTDGLSWLMDWVFLVTGAVLVTHKHDSERTDRAVLVLTSSLMVSCSAVALMLASMQHLVKRASHKLGDKAENREAQAKLRRLRKASRSAAMSTVGQCIFMALFFAPNARRFFGIATYFSLGVTQSFYAVPLFLGVLRSRRRLAHKRQTATRSIVQVLPLRRVSSAETNVAVAREVPTSAVPLAQRGVSLAFLRAFATQKGVGARMTTAEVCETIVKPATSGTAHAYYDLLAQQDQGCKEDGGARWAGKSHYFLSHSWSYRFRELLSILDAFEEQARPASTRYYWFDIFVMNQHSHDDMNNLLGNLQASVRWPGRLLLAIDSWREPTALARAWCLLEIFTAITERCDVVMAFSRAEEASFVRQLVQNQAVVEASIGALDARRAEATVARDHEMIFAAIRNGCGVDTFNDTVRETLRGSLQRIIIAQRSYF